MQPPVDQIRPCGASNQNLFRSDNLAFRLREMGSLQNSRSCDQQQYECITYSVLGAYLLAGLPRRVQDMQHVRRHD